MEVNWHVPKHQISRKLLSSGTRFTTLFIAMKSLIPAYDTLYRIRCWLFGCWVDHSTWGVFKDNRLSSTAIKAAPGTDLQSYTVTICTFHRSIIFSVWGPLHLFCCINQVELDWYSNLVSQWILFIFNLTLLDVESSMRGRKVVLSFMFIRRMDI